MLYFQSKLYLENHYLGLIQDCVNNGMRNIRCLIVRLKCEE